MSAAHLSFSERIAHLAARIDSLRAAFATHCTRWAVPLDQPQLRTLLMSLGYLADATLKEHHRQLYAERAYLAQLFPVAEVRASVVEWAAKAMRADGGGAGPAAPLYQLQAMWVAQHGWTIDTRQLYAELLAAGPLAQQPPADASVHADAQRLMVELTQLVLCAVVALTEPFDEPERHVYAAMARSPLCGAPANATASAPGDVMAPLTQLLGAPDLKQLPEMVKSCATALTEDQTLRTFLKDVMSNIVTSMGAPGAAGANFFPHMPDMDDAQAQAESGTANAGMESNGGGAAAGASNSVEMGDALVPATSS